MTDRQAERALYGAPDDLLTLAISFFRDRARHGKLGKHIWQSRRIPSWTRGAEAVTLARTSYELGDDAVIIEIGSFLGASAVLLAGPRKEKGSGLVYCVDPFDGSGDPFSEPVYRRIVQGKKVPAREWFEANIRRAGLEGWIKIEQGRAEEVVRNWSQPVDLLLMDGDQSYEAVKSAYDVWCTFLKPGGILALHNARPGCRHESHDGAARVGEMVAATPEYTAVRYAGSLMLAQKRRQDLPAIA